MNMDRPEHHSIGLKKRGVEYKDATDVDGLPSVVENDHR